jgi:EmrB/QacA subfamily drug resistance transporter
MKTTSRWLIFILVAIAQFMVVLDVSITNVALPTIQHDLHFTTNALQWVITAYALSFGGFLLFGGRAADLFGRRRMLLIGMIAFTVFSFLIGISHSAVLLIALRALQGLSAAFMSPAALSIVLTTFRDGPERNRALGYWSLVATGGAAVGLLLGGVLTQYLGWRWDFLVNVPVGIVMSYFIYRVVPAHAREEKRTSLDALGALFITSSLMVLVFAFTQAPLWGWLDIKTLGLFGGGLALLGAFLFNESRVRHPLMPLSIFKIRNVTGANLIMVPVTAAMLGTFFLVTLYVQEILHFSPVMSGLSFLPFPVVLGFMSTRIPKLVSRYGYRRFLIAGPIIVGIALFWLSRLPLDGTYFFGLLPAFLLMPIGMGMTIMPTMAAATSGVPAHEAGLASGLISTSQQMGSALGLSVLSGIAASAAAASYVGGSAAAVAGYHVAFLVAVGFALAASAVAFGIIRQPKQKSATVPHAETDLDLQLAAAGH